MSMEMVRYDANGREITSTSYRAELGGDVHSISEVLDRGIVPDDNFKDGLDGTPVTVVGISGPEEFPMGDVYFILLYREGDNTDQDAWGVMFPATSPIVTQTLRMAARGALPFTGTVHRNDSKSQKGQTYWTFSR